MWPAILPSPNRRAFSFFLLISLLCISSYLLGVHLNSRSPFSTFLNPSGCVFTAAGNSTAIAATGHVSSGDGDLLEFLPRHSASAALPPIPPAELPTIPRCGSSSTDYCPCQDPRRERRFRDHNLFHRERHCPGPDEKLQCRVPPPPRYRATVRWPESRKKAWFANVPSKKLSEYKKDQNWVRVEGELLYFPGGGTSFPNGVEAYVGEMVEQVPLKSGEIRTALDIGCGVASFGGHLLDYNILTMSVAPRDVHEAQVQFALERGLPAMLGVLSTHRLPYPSMSFDMAHCARCLIKWASREGLYLLEIDRVLRPGGYWVLSGPPINWSVYYKGWARTPEDLNAEQTAIEAMAKRLCWKKVSEKGAIAVWRKPMDHTLCAKESEILGSPPFCARNDPDATWDVKMENCLTPLPDVELVGKVIDGSLVKWPKRLTAPRLRITRGHMNVVTAETLSHDTELWNRRVLHYGVYLGLLQGGRYRNVMDMNAGFGGFAAALSKYPVWVMNVVPVALANDTLGVIYDRGLIGTYMDWCEAFSTYPRTYDLIHADRLFSMYLGKCESIDILLEMDRILRPTGAVVIRDHVDVLVKVQRETGRLGWQSRIIHSEGGPFHPEKLLLVDNSAKP